MTGRAELIAAVDKFTVTLHDVGGHASFDALWCAHQTAGGVAVATLQQSGLTDLAVVFRRHQELWAHVARVAVADPRMIPDAAPVAYGTVADTLVATGAAVAFVHESLRVAMVLRSCLSRQRRWRHDPVVYALDLVLTETVSLGALAATFTPHATPYLADADSDGDSRDDSWGDTADLDPFDYPTLRDSDNDSDTEDTDPWR